MLPAFALLGVSLAPLPAGCAGKRATENLHALGSPPSDFTVALTVLVQTNRRNVAAIPRPERPARFVMEADWVLRAYSGPAVTDAAFPPETRQLTAAQVQDLWIDLRTAGLLDPAHAGLVGRSPAPGELPSPTWVVSFKAAGDRRTFVLEADSRRAAEPLLSRLCDLAWMPK